MRLEGSKAAPVVLLMFLCSQATAPGDFSDCNDNGVDDTVETATTFTEVLVADEWYPSQLADLDGDGDLDLLGGTRGSPFVYTPLSWRENLDGLGDFGLMTVIHDIEGDVVAGDLDADGDLDLIRRAEGTGCDLPPSIVIYENLGSGSFGTPQVIFHMVNCGGCASNFLGDRWGIGDRDSDGDLDVFTGAVDCSAGKIITVWNDGTGDSWQSTGFTSSGYEELAVADLDGDADNDLVVSMYHYSDALQWFEGPSDDPWHLLFSPATISDVLVKDLDGDGDPDIVGLRNRSPDLDDLAIYENASGLGNYVETQVIAPTVTSTTTRIAIADLDGNGDTDVLWITDSDLWWHVNTHGSFGGPELLVGDFGDRDLRPTGIDSGDIDGDGDTDLLVSYRAFTCSCCGPSGCNSSACRQIVCDQDPFCCDAWDGACASLASLECCCCDPTDCDHRLVWYRNDGNDCNGNGVPDECEPDCDDNGITDACDIRSGTSADCDGNGTPDECDTGCPGGSCDQDGDGCQDGVDDVSNDATACADTDADGCDDCSSGVFDPANDGANGDSDGVCDLTDCDPANNEVWDGPSAATGLSLDRDGAVATLAWSRPAAAGGIALRYDVLRSSSASDFVSGATTLCLESDDGDESASDADVPAQSEVFHYLVRVENDCPGGGGSMGTNSIGVPREGIPCGPVPSGAGLVLNEVNYTVGPSDPGQYVEVFNPSEVSVDLSSLALIFVNSSGAEYLRVSLAPASVLPPEGYLVAAEPSVNVDPGASVIPLPDESNLWLSRGVALFDLGAISLLDALSYEAAITAATFDGVPGTWNLVEGTLTPWADNHTEDGSMVRFPDGLDTDDDATDWGVSGPPTGSPTPGSANAPPW